MSSGAPAGPKGPGGGLRQLALKGTFDSDEDDILSSFYIPALSVSTAYRRLAGFFSSSTLAVSARGMAQFVKNGGKMELLCGAKLSKADVEEAKRAESDPGRVIADAGIRELSELEEGMIKDHVKAMGWMVATGRLAIKIAVVRTAQGEILPAEAVDDSLLYHHKVGILSDGVDTISFSGSDNETARGWTQHVEEFKVFRSWEPSQQEFLQSDIRKFEKFWNDRAVRTTVLDLPQALHRKLVELAPPDFPEDALSHWAKVLAKPQVHAGLWAHQQKAIDEWNQSAHRAIAEMATGAGKTRVAVECIRESFDQRRTAIAVVSVPYSHLMPQWVAALESAGLASIPRLIADSSNPGWHGDLANRLLDIKLGRLDHLIILTTHDSLAAPALVEPITTYVSSALLVADEVHGLGSPVRRNGLIPAYTERLGLSATPTRWFDEEGTQLLVDYFGPSIGIFTIRQGIDTVSPETGESVLTPYEYWPIFVELDGEEFEKYLEISEKIAQTFGMLDGEPKKEQHYEFLLFERQRILNAASAKLPALEKLVRSLRTPVHHLLIYCAPEQRVAIQELLRRLGIKQHKFTMVEGVVPRAEFQGRSEREEILRNFSEGRIQALVAMQCLDEGVNVPEARTGILMASSSNPRQFIQRRGRLLRRCEGKDRAVLYDLIATPPRGAYNGRPEAKKAEERIMNKELARMSEFARDAINVASALDAIDRYLGQK